METSSTPPQTIDLAPYLYYQLVYTLTDLLPPPLDETPEALRARDQAAIAKVAALLPVNANEADLAAQCIAARSQAEDLLRLLRQNADDIGLVMRLNAQYGSMVRTSLSVHGRLMRVQALRQKRQAIEGAGNQDEWTQHIAERSMVGVVNPTGGPLQAAWPKAASAEVSKAAPVAVPTLQVDQRIKEDVSENNTNPHDAAFETWMSEQPWNQEQGTPDETSLRKRLREAMAGSRLAGPELPANSPESPAGG